MHQPADRSSGRPAVRAPRTRRDRRDRSLRAAVGRGVEPLETRVLLAAFGSVDASGILTVNGDNSGDTISASQSGSSVTVTFNGTPATFNGVTGIVINGGSGDD